MSQYVIIRKQLQKKGVGQADKVCTRIFAKEGIYKSAGVFLCKRQVYKWIKIRDQKKTMQCKIDLKRHNAQ